jgi:two-component system, LuxR family, response regulator FixJ
MAEPAAVHVIDDDEAVRHSLEFLLDCAGIPVRTYESGLAFLKVVGDLRSGCILTDVRMPDLDGLALQQKLLQMGIRLPIIVMTGHGDVPIAVQALKAGASDFIEKPFEDEVLVAAVRSALDASLRSQEREKEAEEIAARLATLTPRERQVLDRLVAGQPNKTIAFDLGASPRTVEVHRARVMEKMGARSFSELVRMAVSVGAGGTR